MRLDGPVLGTLTAEAKQLLRDIETRFVQQKQEYANTKQRAGESADSAELARLEEANRRELAKVLTGPQLEEYLLRYSEVAQNLRREYQSFEVSPEEFRSIFRSAMPSNSNCRFYAGGTDPASVQRREDLENERGSVKQALGTDRYQLLQYSKDPIFPAGTSVRTTERAPPDAVWPIYQINQAADLERQHQ